VPCAQSTELLEVTVIVRWIPLVTAAYGTRVARPARTTMLRHLLDDLRPNGGYLDSKLLGVAFLPLVYYPEAQVVGY
jgi:hypothetical protein